MSARCRYDVNAFAGVSAELDPADLDAAHDIGGPLRGDEPKPVASVAPDVVVADDVIRLIRGDAVLPVVDVDPVAPAGVDLVAGDEARLSGMPSGEAPEPACRVMPSRTLASTMLLA